MPKGDCWLWQGATNGRYARMRLRAPEPERWVYVHRWMYEELRGPIPEGLVIDHLCRTLLCVNPWHLEPVTQAENLRRGNITHDPETGRFLKGRADASRLL